MKDNEISLGLAPGEAYLRVCIEEDGETKFSCGLYPKYNTPKAEVPHGDMLAILMSGMANILQNDMDYVLSMGLEYAEEGYKPFDFIVSPEDIKYYETLTDSDIKLLHMEPEGEA